MRNAECRGFKTIGLELATRDSVPSVTTYNLADRIRPTVRRFVGILTGICALYLTVGAVDVPCVDHDGSSSESGSAVTPHHGGSHHELPAQKSDQPKPCKTAVPCCVAMTSCGTTIALGAGVRQDAFHIAGQIVPDSHLAQPLSRIAAPEPPPPKA
jgi:hypothetical protein